MTELFFCRSLFHVEFLISDLLMAFMLDYPLTIQIFQILRQCLTFDISGRIQSHSFSLQRYVLHILNHHFPSEPDLAFQNRQAFHI